MKPVAHAGKPTGGKAKRPKAQPPSDPPPVFHDHWDHLVGGDLADDAWDAHVGEAVGIEMVRREQASAAQAEARAAKPKSQLATRKTKARAAKLKSKPPEAAAAVG